MSRTTRRTMGVAVAGICAAALAAPALAAAPDASNAPGKTQIDIQILSFNDFHGNLETPSGSSARVVTGHFVDSADTDKENTVTVAAGDLVGATPLLSAAFHDEPSIEAMNELGLDVAAVGNHEFDEGYRELQRL